MGHIGQNVKKNKNYFEKNRANNSIKALYGSNGAENTGFKNQVENNDVSNEKFGSEKMDHYNIDNATNERVEKAILDLVNSVKDGEQKKLSKDEVKKIIK